MSDSHVNVLRDFESSCNVRDPEMDEEDFGIPVDAVPGNFGKAGVSSSSSSTLLLDRQEYMRRVCSVQNCVKETLSRMGKPVYGVDGEGPVSIRSPYPYGGYGEKTRGNRECEEADPLLGRVGTLDRSGVSGEGSSWRERGAVGCSCVVDVVKRILSDVASLKLAFRVALATTLAALLFIVPSIKSTFGVGTLPVSTCLIVVQNSLGGSLKECHRRIIGTVLAVLVTVLVTNIYWAVPPEGFTSSTTKEAVSMVVFFAFSLE